MSEGLKEGAPVRHMTTEEFERIWVDPLFNDPGGHRAAAAKHKMLRASQMASNRAALPTSPLYPPAPVSPEALFKQLREAGVSCDTCVLCRDQAKQRFCIIWYEGMQDPHTFYCEQWRATAARTARTSPDPA